MKGDKDGLFTVKANYKMLEGRNTRAVPLKMLWNSCVPPEVNFFAWEVWWGKVLTLEQLKKRGFSWLIDVFCVAKMKRAWITFYFTVLQFGIDGQVISLFPAFLGLAPFWLRICFPARPVSLLQKGQKICG